MSSAAANPRLPLGPMVRSPEGKGRPGGELLDRDLTRVQHVRYLGCLACQRWLVDLDHRVQRLPEERSGTVAIRRSAGHPAIEEVVAVAKVMY